MIETVPESNVVIVPPPPLPSPPLSQINPGWHRGGGLPLGGVETVTDCSVPLMVTVALARFPEPVYQLTDVEANVPGSKDPLMKDME